jgi:caffeoyl-CoA O-methyltransferase
MNGAPGIVATRPRPVTPVGILAAKLSRLCDTAEALGDLDAEFVSELRSARTLAAGLEPYVAHCTSPESPALAALAAQTQAHDWTRRGGEAVALEPEMLSGHVEGMALRFLVTMTGARRVLELGMFTGYSALALAEALPADGRLVACELDPEAADLAQENFAQSPAGARIDVRLGPALQTLEALEQAGDTFDLVFVDADKRGYLDYVCTLIDGRLLAPGGVICVDNTLLQGEPWMPTPPSPNGAAIATFNAVIAGDPRVEQVLLPLRDGMTLIRRA